MLYYHVSQCNMTRYQSSWPAPAYREALTPLASPMMCPKSVSAQALVYSQSPH